MAIREGVPIQIRDTGGVAIREGVPSYSLRVEIEFPLTFPDRDEQRGSCASSRSFARRSSYPLPPLPPMMMMLMPFTPTTTTTTTNVTTTAPATTRPAVILPGLGNNTGDYQGLASTLREVYGLPSLVARVSRLDWFRNAAGLLDPNYWRGTLRPRPVLDWYLDRVEEAVSEAKQLSQEGGAGISLIGHSAGGWLARVYMEEFRPSNISLLLTLGSPHLYGSLGYHATPKGLARSH